jgi:DNA-directed RNA polymerase subunit RPC12/RpoP
MSTAAGAAGPLGNPLSAALDRAHSFQAKASDLAGTGPSSYVACPSCGYDMIATSVIPTFLREGHEDINYTCKKCGAQIQRTVKKTS